MPEAHFPSTHRGELRLGGASLIRCVVLLHFNPLIQMECLGWELRICAEFTPLPDFFDESAKNGPG
jgi:hypothetical protein